MDYEKEEVDLVDGNDKKIGTIDRSEISQLKNDGDRYVRTACAFIINSQGEYWVPRRTADKRIAPNGLDFAMAEHMGADEDYLDAAIRGFKEELNLELSPKELRLLGIIGPVPDLPYFQAIYLYKSDVAPSYNPADFTDSFWSKPSDVIQRLENGEVAKSALLPAMKFAMLVAT